MGVVFDDDFGPLNPPPSGGADAEVKEDGDRVVPTRSQTRSRTWGVAQAAAGKQLVHKAYPKQEHAACFLVTAGKNPVGHPQKSGDMKLDWVTFSIPSAHPHVP